MPVVSDSSGPPDMPVVSGVSPCPSDVPAASDSDSSGPPDMPAAPDSPGPSDVPAASDPFGSSGCAAPAVSSRVPVGSPGADSSDSPGSAAPSGASARAESAAGSSGDRSVSGPAGVWA